MKFYLVGGQIKFLTHKVEYTQRNELKEMSFYDVEKKDTLLARLAEKEIAPTVTEYDQPSEELLAKCQNKTFNTYEEALQFVETGEIPLTENEVILLAIAELYEITAGGAQ